MDNQDHHPLDMQTQVASDPAHVEDASVSKTKYRKISNRVRGLIVDNVIVRNISILFMELSLWSIFRKI
jgi:hypothetical protein